MRLLVILCALTAASCSFLGGSAPALRTARPALPAARFASMQAEAAAPSEDEKPLQSAKPVGPLSKLKESLPPAKELKKVLPLGLMFFFILFSYTILRDTKDVLVVTAPKSGAEIIPFLKTYVNLPGAIGFTVLYSELSNRFSRETVFTGVVGFFIAFFALFAAVIYPQQALLHPTAAVDALAAVLPSGFAAPLAIIRNWTYALFYTMAELWGSVVVSLLFWGFANEVTKVEEAKKYYPLFGLGANVALIFSGQYVRFVSSLRRAAQATASAAVDPWQTSLNWLMGAVAMSGAMVLALFRYMQTRVMTDPECVPPQALKKTKTKTKMTLKESAAYLANSAYIRNLAALVICYGMSINIVEVSWKAKLKQAFPNPNDYAEFMGAFSSCTGAVTLGMMLLGQRIFKIWGWGVAALVTPALLFATGAAFFGLTLFSSQVTPLIAALGTTPLMLAVVIGAAQNIISKSAKYSLFDPCKEMAYIPLGPEEKTKGKAAVDVIGNPLGKSGGSFIQQFMIFGFGSLAASTPYLAGVLGLVIFVWIRSARALSVLFEDAMAKEELDA
jgi:AAA family ATP:ADP antiporter